MKLNTKKSLATGLKCLRNVLHNGKSRISYEHDKLKIGNVSVTITDKHEKYLVTKPEIHFYKRKLISNTNSYTIYY